jgi:hypothetical protein
MRLLAEWFYGLFLGGDDQGFLIEGIKTCVLAAMYLLQILCLSQFTLIVFLQDF